MSLASQVETIAGYNLHKPGHLGINLSQTYHRIKLVEAWGIGPGERVLEIGCGQGDCTAVLASAVGDAGHVTAVDPGRPDYGTLTTLIDFGYSI